jgi:hypothetical protein
MSKKSIKEVAGAEQVAGDPVPGTDVVVGGIEATDIFALGGDFEAQSSGSDAQSTRAALPGSVGDEVASKLHDAKTVVSCTYKYKAASGTIAVTDLYIGKVTGGYHIDGFQVAYSNTDWPTVTVTGHNHGANAHEDDAMVIIEPVLSLPAGFGCADLFVDAGTASSCVSANYTLSATHNDKQGKDGNHLVGDNFGGLETITATYYGIPTLTTTGYDVTSTNSTDSNADFDQVSISATAAVARTVIP